MRPVLLEPPLQRWGCPSCGALHETRELRPHTPMHTCPQLAGLSAPFVPYNGAELAAAAAHHVVVEREDYVGTELVTVNGYGRPIQAVNTVRADGSNDCHAFAACATTRRD